MATDPRLARTADPRLAAVAAAPPPPPPSSVVQPIPLVSSGLEKSTNGAGQNGEAPEDAGGFKLKFCTVCAMNQNRSMEAHLRLSQANYPVISFGTGSLIRLPGPTINQPNVYPFNVTAYSQMYTELSVKDPRLYRANGVLPMLERNRGVKFGPERWHDWAVGKPRLERYKEEKGSKGTEGGVVDIVITCEERCWDAVIDNLQERGSPLNRPVHVINVDIKDNPEEALVGGRAILDLANTLNAAARAERAKASAEEWNNGTGTGRMSFDERVPEIVGEWQERWPLMPSLWTLAWF